MNNQLINGRYEQLPQPDKYNYDELGDFLELETAHMIRDRIKCVSDITKLKYYHMIFKYDRTYDFVDDHVCINVVFPEQNHIREYAFNSEWLSVNYHAHLLKSLNRIGMRYILLFRNTLEADLSKLDVIDGDSISNLDLYEESGSKYYKLDNRFNTYEFFKFKDNFEFIRYERPQSWICFHNDNRTESFDEYKKTMCEDEPEYFRSEYHYASVYHDCGYQVLKLKEN